MELPADGWVKVLSGRRSPSEQWPMASKNTMKVEARTKSRVPSGCFGSTRYWCEGATSGSFRRAKEGRQAVRVNPDIVKAEAVAKVERLQKSLDALEDQRSTPSRELSRRLRRSHENDPSQNSSRSARSSSSVPPSASQS